MNKKYGKRESAIMEDRIANLGSELMAHHQNLIYILEFDVRNGIICYGQNPFMFNEQYVWFNPDPNMQVLPFNPFYNPKLTRVLFEHYILMYQNINNVSILSYFTHTEKNEMYVATVRLNGANGTHIDISSDMFENEAVAIIDLIYKLEGDNSNNLRDIDEKISYVNYKYFMEKK